MIKWLLKLWRQRGWHYVVCCDDCGEELRGIEMWTDRGLLQKHIVVPPCTRCLKEEVDCAQAAIELQMSDEREALRRA